MGLTTQIPVEQRRLYPWCTAHRWRCEVWVTVAIRGVEGGGLVEGPPNDGTRLLLTGRCRTQVPNGDRYYRRREKELSDLGFIPLVHVRHDMLPFFGTQSAQKAKKYDTDAANANARLSTQLQ